jgi:hypothetical protein
MGKDRGVILLHYLLDCSLVRAMIVGGLGSSCGRHQRLSGGHYRQKGKSTECEIIQLQHDVLLSSKETNVSICRASDATLSAQSREAQMQCRNPASRPEYVQAGRKPCDPDQFLRRKMGIVMTSRSTPLADSEISTGIAPVFCAI